MRFDFRGLYRNTALIFVCLYSIAFAVFYAAALVAFDVEFYHLYDVIYASSGFISTGVGMLIPAVSALLLMPVLDDRGFLNSLPTAIILSLPSLVYNLLYNYLLYISYGFDSVEAIILALLYSLMLVLISALLTLTVSYIALRVLHKRGADLYSFTTKSNPFAVKTASGASVLIICSASFILAFVSELIDTVSYLIEYVGRYRLDEIGLISMRFLFILGVFVFSLWLLNFMKYKILLGRFIEV